MRLIGRWTVAAGQVLLAAGALAATPATDHRPADGPGAKGQAGETVEALRQLAPRGVYVVVDTASNLVYLKRGAETLYTARASTGSGALLVDPRDPSRGWKFDTPRGIFTITSKLVNPVWIKPDWAFIEEGQPVPTDREDRIETGVLGQYALGFGDGYFIHGTLYTRLLGTNVTHGCIRLGEEDLRHVFQAVSLGAAVIIF
jgi:L,D-transpeptidase YbiS